MQGKDHTHWVNRPGGIDQILTAKPHTIRVVLMDELVLEAERDLDAIKREEYPSSTFPKDVVVEAATKRLLAARQMRQNVRQGD